MLPCYSLSMKEHLSAFELSNKDSTIKRTSVWTHSYMYDEEIKLKADSP